MVTVYLHHVHHFRSASLEHRARFPNSEAYPVNSPIPSTSFLEVENAVLKWLYSIRKHLRNCASGGVIDFHIVFVSHLVNTTHRLGNFPSPTHVHPSLVVGIC